MRPMRCRKLLGTLKRSSVSWLIERAGGVRTVPDVPFQMLTALELGTAGVDCDCAARAVADDSHEPEHLCASWGVWSAGYD